jgi:alanyl-tRNA synthetase
LLARQQSINGVACLISKIDDIDAATLRDMSDKLMDKLESGLALLACVADGKVSLIARVSKDLTGKVKAGELVNQVALQVGGKGGGRPDMAQAGGTSRRTWPPRWKACRPGWKASCNSVVSSAAAGAIRRLLSFIVYSFLM